MRKAPEAADFRSPMPQAPVVDSRSRTRPVSAAQPWERSRTLLPWRSPRVMQAPEQVVAQPEQEVPVVAEPVALVGRVVPAAVVQVQPAVEVQALPERVALEPAA